MTKEQTPVSDTVVVAVRVKTAAKEVIEKVAAHNKTTVSEIMLSALRGRVPGFEEANG